MILIFNTIQ